MNNKHPIIVLFTLVLLSCSNVRAQLYPSAPFQVGEQLNYTVALNFIQGGQASMSVTGMDTLNGFPCYHIVSHTRSTGLVDRLYPVRDHIESWIDSEGFFSRRLKKDIKEGRYHKKYAVRFDYQDSLARSADDTVRITEPIHDGLSIFYYLRTRQLQIGQQIAVNNFDNDKFKPFRIMVTRREMVSVPAGTFDCYVLEPVSGKRALFKKYENEVTVYLSKDQHRLPVMIINKANFGNMILKLESFLLDPRPSSEINIKE